MIFINLLRPTIVYVVIALDLEYFSGIQKKISPKFSKICRYYGYQSLRGASWLHRRRRKSQFRMDSDLERKFSISTRSFLIELK